MTKHCVDLYCTSGTSPPTPDQGGTMFESEPVNTNAETPNPEPAPTPIEAARRAVRDALQLARVARERIDSVKVENRQRIVDAKADAEQAEETAREVIGGIMARLAFEGQLDAFIFDPKLRKPGADLEEAIEEAEAQERYTAEARQRVLDIVAGKRSKRGAL